MYATGKNTLQVPLKSPGHTDEFGIFTIFSVLALLNTEILVYRLMWMLLICALNYFNYSYLTLLTVQDLPVCSRYIFASCKSFDLAEIEFTF